MQTGCGKIPIPDNFIQDVDSYTDPNTGNRTRIRGDSRGPTTTLNANGTQNRSGIIGAFGREIWRNFSDPYINNGAAPIFMGR